jgi:hypothetical protein
MLEPGLATANPKRLCPARLPQIWHKSRFVFWHEPGFDAGEPTVSKPGTASGIKSRNDLNF